MVYSVGRGGSHGVGVGMMTDAMTLFQRSVQRQRQIEQTAARFQSTPRGSSHFTSIGLALRRLLIDQLCDVANAQRGIQDARGYLAGNSSITAGQIQRELGTLIQDAGQDLAAVNALLGLPADDVQPR